MLSFEPETFASLKARMPAAIDHVHRVGVTPCPGEERHHIFDYADGLRMIVSRSHFPGDAKACLHVSASTIEDTRIEAAIKSGRLSKDAFCHDAMARLRMLGVAEPLQFLGFSDGLGVPHWKGEVPA